MTDTMQIRLQDSNGKTYRWTIRRAPNQTWLRLGHKPQTIHGWEFTDHEGYTRFNEGNWLALVWRFKTVAENYGLALMSELS